MPAVENGNRLVEATNLSTLPSNIKDGCYPTSRAKGCLGDDMENIPYILSWLLILGFIGAVAAVFGIVYTGQQNSTYPLQKRVVIMYKTKIIDGEGSIHIHENEDIDMLNWKAAMEWAEKLAEAWFVIANDGEDSGIPTQVIGLGWNQDGRRALPSAHFVTYKSFSTSQ